MSRCESSWLGACLCFGFFCFFASVLGHTEQPKTTKHMLLLQLHFLSTHFPPQLCQQESKMIQMCFLHQPEEKLSESPGEEHIHITLPVSLRNTCTLYMTLQCIWWIMRNNIQSAVKAVKINNKIKVLHSFKQLIWANAAYNSAHANTYT